MASFHIYDKILKSLLLWNQWIDFHEFWSVAQGTLAHYILFTLLPLDDLDLFYDKFKFCNLGFYTVKCNNYGFFLQHVAWKLVDIVNFMSKLSYMRFP